MRRAVKAFVQPEREQRAARVGKNCCATMGRRGAAGNGTDAAIERDQQRDRGGEAGASARPSEAGRTSDGQKQQPRESFPAAKPPPALRLGRSPAPNASKRSGMIDRSRAFGLRRGVRPAAARRRSRAAQTYPARQRRRATADGQRNR